MSEVKQSGKGSQRRKKSSTPSKDGKKQAPVGRAREPSADTTGPWQILKGDADVDNYIYGLHDGMVDRVLDEMREKRATREKITAFVDAFCEAWFKLVKWRWMVLDDEREGNTRSDGGEPEGCREDAWVAHSYGEPRPEKIRTTLGAPMRCCPHPQPVRARELDVEPPVIERALKKKKKAISVPATSDEQRRSSPSTKTVKVEGEATVLPNIMQVPKTAFPERAEAKIVVNQKEKASKKGASNQDKTHVSEVDLRGQPTNADCNRTSQQHYSRLDL